MLTSRFLCLDLKGFCTPGIIVSIYTLLANKASVPYLEEHLDGNLCRCTGYRPIWDAARSLCDDSEELVKGPCGTPCRECPERDECEQDCNTEDKVAEVKVSEGTCCSSSKDKMSTYKDTFMANKETWSTQPDIMFPAELLDVNSAVSVALSKPLMIVDTTDFHAGGTWFKPTTLAEFLSLLHEFGGTGAGSCKIVVGNTEVGIETKFKHAVYPRLISPSDSIQELFGFSSTDKELLIGSCCPLSMIQHKCEALGEQPAMARTTMPIHDMLRWFASAQIRNVACLGGNLVTASPISDMNPMLASMNAKLVLSKIEGASGAVVRRSVPVSEFFLKYRTVNLDPTEVVERVEVPVLQPVFEYLRPFKQARRREDDISIVTSGMRIRLAVNGEKYMIEDIALAFGGMAPTTVLALETAKVMIGSEFSLATFEKATETLLKEMKLPEGVPGGQAAYRMTLVASFLYKFFLSVVEDLKADVKAIKANPSGFPDISTELPATPDLAGEEESGTHNFLRAKKPNYSGVQMYPAPRVAKGLEEEILPPVKDAKAGEVGKAATHQSAPLHCTGEAIYTDDIPQPPGTLQAALILSGQCGAVFEALDISPALATPGVVGVYSYTDLMSLGGKNEYGPIVQDETVFLPPGEKVRTVGQVLGVVVAESLESAELGARLCKVQYGETQGKIIVTCEDAIEANSFYEVSRHHMVRGELSIIDNLASTADSSGTPKIGDIIKVSGSFRSGAQEHFYLETNTTLVVPSEDDLTVYSSTQAITKTQNFCASATGTPASKVVARVKRMGGAFGGKETRSVFVACAAAVAAKITSRPVRLTLSRDVDMKITGTRHVFLSTYHASAQMTEEGPKLLAFDVKIYANAGSGFDLSG
jgi:xanthine dehydrogenase/oxidase